MKGVHHIFRVTLNDVGVGQYGYPVVLPTFRCLDTIHAETSGQAGDTTEDRLK